jgi:hypothetical protein
MGAGEAQFLAEEIRQVHAGLNKGAMRLAVHQHFNRNHFERLNHDDAPPVQADKIVRETRVPASERRYCGLIPGLPS